MVKLRMLRAALVVVLASLVSAVPALGPDGPPASANDATSPLGSGFLWGVATAGFQSEGASPDSNWRRYSNSGGAPDRIGTSVDFRHRYRADIARARDLGVDVFRVSVEWARIEPRPGHRSAHALAYYDDMMARMHAAGLRPMITLDHWVYPGWEADRGGWKRAGMVDDWLANARFVVRRYAKYDPIWITINEASAYFTEEVKIGSLAPTDLPAFADRLVAAHRGIYDFIHRVQPGARVSSNVAYIPTAEPVLDAFYLDRIADKIDFVGIDYYYSSSPTSPGSVYALAGEKMWKADSAADGIYYALQHYAELYPKLPLYIVENGLPTENGAARPDGYRRADHLRDIVYWMERAKADGYDVIGYNYWSLTDNYEWGSYTPRFGLYRVDVKTDPALIRHATAAVAAYRDVIARNGVPSGYTPTRPATFCSLVNGLESCLGSLL